MQAFNEIDKVLASKSLPPLTDEEKSLLKKECQRALIEWNMIPKATNEDYALKKQVTTMLSNIIYDVLVKTRGYK